MVFRDHIIPSTYLLSMVVCGKNSLFSFQSARSTDAKTAFLAQLVENVSILYIFIAMYIIDYIHPLIRKSEISNKLIYTGGRL